MQVLFSRLNVFIIGLDGGYFRRCSSQRGGIELGRARNMSAGRGLVVAEGGLGDGGQKAARGFRVQGLRLRQEAW